MPANGFIVQALVAKNSSLNIAGTQKVGVNQVSRLHTVRSAAIMGKNLPALYCFVTTEGGGRRLHGRSAH